MQSRVSNPELGSYAAFRTRKVVNRRGIVVLEKDEHDPHALRLACLWALWTAARDQSAAGDCFDADKLLATVDGARRALRSASAVLSSHTQAKNAIDQAGRQFTALLADVTTTLDELQALVTPTT